MSQANTYLHMRNRLAINAVFKFILDKLFKCSTIKELMSHPLFKKSGQLVLFDNSYELEVTHTLKTDHIEILIKIDDTTQVLSFHSIRCTVGNLSFLIDHDRGGFRFSFIKDTKAPKTTIESDFHYMFATGTVDTIFNFDGNLGLSFWKDKHRSLYTAPFTDDNDRYLVLEALKILFSSDLRTNIHAITETIMNEITIAIDDAKFEDETYANKLNSLLSEMYMFVETISSDARILVPIKTSTYFNDLLYGCRDSNKVPVLFNEISKAPINVNKLILTLPLDNRDNRLYRIENNAKRLKEFDFINGNIYEVLEDCIYNYNLTDNVPNPIYSTKHMKDAYCISNPFMEALTKINPNLSGKRIPLLYRISHIHTAMVQTSPLLDDIQKDKFINIPITISNIDIDNIDIPKYESVEKVTMVDSTIWDGKTYIYIESKYSKIAKAHAEDLDESIIVEICGDTIRETVTISAIDKNNITPIVEIAPMSSKNDLVMIKENIEAMHAFAYEHPTPLVESLLTAVMQYYQYDISRRIPGWKLD